MSHALKRTTAHEIEFAIPLISGEYLNVVVPDNQERDGTIPKL